MGRATSMNHVRARTAGPWCAALLILLANWQSFAAAPARVEAKSKTFMAVGLLDGDRMVIHLSRQLDNTPVRDASLHVNIRALDFTATAQTDGSYEVRDPQLKADGPAVVAFLVKQGEVSEKLVGTLEVPAATKTVTEDGQMRQFLWWVLNFTVCIGFLVLISRRRKAAAARGED